MRTLASTNAGPASLGTRDSQVAICEALGAVDASMLATVAPKHLLSLGDAYARPLALAPPRGPASNLRGVSWRNPARPRSSPEAQPVPSFSRVVVETVEAGVARSTKPGHAPPAAAGQNRRPASFGSRSAARCRPLRPASRGSRARRGSDDIEDAVGEREAPFPALGERTPRRPRNARRAAKAGTTARGHASPRGVNLRGLDGGMLLRTGAVRRQWARRHVRRLAVMDAQSCARVT